VTVCTEGFPQRLEHAGCQARRVTSKGVERPTDAIMPRQRLSKDADSSPTIGNRTESGPRTFFWFVVLLMPSFMAAYAITAARSHLPLVSGFWFLFELSRLLAFAGLVIATGITVDVARQHSSSIGLVLLMGLSIAGAAGLLWYASQTSEQLWTHPPTF
jgi:hypothetical protein